MGNGVQRGGRDFWEPGTFDAMCAYCGRKRKANEMVRDNEFARGLWCCPEHADQRHPQDYARGVKEDMSTPFVQPPIIYFRTINTTFPVAIAPDPVVIGAQLNIVTEPATFNLITEGGQDLTTEVGTGQGYVSLVLPPWISLTNAPFGVYLTEVEWTLLSGTGITINSPENPFTFLSVAAGATDGVLQVQATNSLGEIGTAIVEVIV
jgi:hypothetical protein